MCVSRFSLVWLFATLWTVARQVPLSTGFSRQEYWSGLPYPPSGDLPEPGIKPVSTFPVLADMFLTTSTTRKPKTLLAFHYALWAWALFNTTLLSWGALGSSSGIHHLWGTLTYGFCFCFLLAFFFFLVSWVHFYSGYLFATPSTVSR